MIAAKRRLRPVPRATAALVVAASLGMALAEPAVATVNASADPFGASPPFRSAGSAGMDQSAGVDFGNALDGVGANPGEAVEPASGSALTAPAGEPPNYAAVDVSRVDFFPGTGCPIALRDQHLCPHWPVSCGLFGGEIVARYVDDPRRVLAPRRGARRFRRLRDCGGHRRFRRRGQQEPAFGDPLDGAIARPHRRSAPGRTASSGRGR